MKSRLTWFVILAMIAGLLFGLLLHEILIAGPATDGAATAFSLLATSFLRLIKMIIAPLVFRTLGIGAQALGWFVIATLISMSICLAAVDLLKPRLSLSSAAIAVGMPAATQLALKGFLDHSIPSSVVRAMANYDILEIEFFPCFLAPQPPV